MNHAPRLILGVLTLLLFACREPGTTGTPDAATADPAAPPAAPPAAAASEYRFDVGGRVFEPASGFAPDFLAVVEKSIAERQEHFTGAPQSTFVLVQFLQPLDRVTRQGLESRGVVILDRITAHTWIASANLAGARSLMSDPTVRWADLYPDDAKLAPGARRPEPFDWQTRAGGQAAYLVLFHGNVPADEVQALPHAVPGLVLEEFDPGTFPVLHTATVVIDPRALPELASIHAVRWIEPEPAPVTDLNLNHAQPASHVDDVQGSPFNLSGQGITVGIWEAGGVVDTSPLDLAGRVIVQGGQAANRDDHAAHVAGTVGASGVNVPDARGMAPAVTIASWDMLQETSELIKAGNSAGGTGAPTPIVASNHSYGAVIGWYQGGTRFRDNQDSFGQYSILSKGFDMAVLNAGLTIVIAAGNDREDAAAEPGAGKPPPDCHQASLTIAADCISPRASAKNVLAVGASNGAEAIAAFSSFGPTDDGRIKPDLMAHGFETLSLACNCYDDRDGDGVDDVLDTTTAKRILSGTSMAAPVVTGVVALLFEEAANQGISLTAASMKALLIHTARDMAGIGQSHAGPDFATGWGIVNARAAANLLRQPAGPRLVHATLDDAGAENAWSLPFNVPEGLAELKVTLAWTDLVGNTTDAPANPELVNDLDLRLIAPGERVFRPWLLDPANPAAAAVRDGGDDTRNTVEQVVVSEPRPGAWRVLVTAKPGSLVFGAQRFALAGSVPLDS